MSDCIFCKIAEREMPVKPVYEDDEIFAFNDLNPQAPVHVLVIPKRHITNIAQTQDSDIALLGALLRAAAKIGETLGVADSGYRLVANVGSDGGQTVDHLHIHLLAGRPMHWPPG